MKAVAISGAIFGAALVGSVSIAAVGEDGERLVFETSEPELVQLSKLPNRLLSEQQYATFSEQYEDRDGIVIVRELPHTDAPLLGYGINFVFGGLNRGYAVFGTSQDGYRLYADVDADGSLADEEGWLLEESEGRYTASFETVDSGQAKGKPVEFSIHSRFELVPAAERESDRSAVVWNAGTVRRGEIRIEGKTVPFELYGRVGKYSHRNHSIWFDLDGNGQGGESRESPERFRILDKYVNIGDKSYAFEVDPFGRHLTLVSEEEGKEERPSLAVGEPAPDFQATVVSGESIALTEHAGDVVLLYFWADWCGPCHEEAPRMAELYQRWGDNGLQTIGVTTDSDDTIKDYTSEYGHDWPQVAEAFEGPMHRAYRVAAYPTKYLIDRDGDLLCGGPGPSFWEDCWPRALDKLESASE